MAAGAPSILYGCITHVPLSVRFPDFVTTICLGAAQAPGQHNLRDLAPEWEPHHPVLGGMAGTFALKNLLLQQQPRPQRVGVCQYRKFVSRQRVSRIRAKGYGVMEVVEKRLLPVQRLAALMQPDDEPFLLCPSFSMKKEQGYLGQYGAQHHAEDLLRFTAEAVAQGLLESREAVQFLNEAEFIPGGMELGVFPADFWLENISAIENITRACVQRYPVARAGTQARVWAYCMERLGGFLLLRHLRSTGPAGAWSRSGWKRRCTGHMNLIVEDGQRRYVVGN